MALHALVVADGAAPTRRELELAWPGWDDGAGLVIAADGGADLADSLGLRIDRWIGDGDSLGPDGLAALRRRGVSMQVLPVDKEASDAELCVLAAVEAGADRITILGALGGPRPDHAFANAGLLGHPAVAGRSVAIVDPSARMRLLVGPGQISAAGRIGDLVSLIPMDTVVGVTTRGLTWPLADEDLATGSTRGLSNRRADASARIEIRAGRLLVLEAPATLST